MVFCSFRRGSGECFEVDHSAKCDRVQLNSRPPRPLRRTTTVKDQPASTHHQHSPVGHQQWRRAKFERTKAARQHRAHRCTLTTQIPRLPQQSPVSACSTPHVELVASIEQIDNAPEERQRCITINLSHWSFYQARKRQLRPRRLPLPPTTQRTVITRAAR